jgi:hypothetical protein
VQKQITACDIIDRKMMSGETGGCRPRDLPPLFPGTGHHVGLDQIFTHRSKHEDSVDSPDGENTVRHAEVSGRVHSSYAPKSKVLTFSRQGSSALFGTYFSFWRTAAYCDRSCNL